MENEKTMIAKLINTKKKKLINTFLHLQKNNALNIARDIAHGLISLKLL